MNTEGYGFDWYATQPENVKRLIERVEDFSDLFSDMTFEPGSITADFTALKAQIGDGDWVDADADRPDSLEYFTYEWFRFRIAELEEGTCGQFDQKNQIVTISPKYVDQDSTILHELIHLHEFVIDELPSFYHDVLCYCLYKSLIKKIPDLDDRIMSHGHLLNEQALSERGGIHDLLFLMKSFDLDIKMGYRLGTVFGYGMAEE